MGTRTKIEVPLDNVKEIEVHYEEPRYGLWAIVCYNHHQNKPYALAEYYVYGKNSFRAKIWFVSLMHLKVTIFRLLKQVLKRKKTLKRDWRN